MKKKRIIAILMIVFGIVLIGGAFLLGNDDSEPSKDNNGSDKNDKGQEGVYCDPSSPEATQINLLEQMQKLEYKYKDISVTQAYVLATPGVNSFDGYFKNNSDKTLKDFNMVFVFYDKNNKEVYRFTDQNPEVKPGEVVMLRAETMTYLGDVVRFEIKEA